MRKFPTIPRKMGLLALCCPMLLSGGCASVATLYGDASHSDHAELPNNRRIPRVYSGVALDIAYITQPGEDGGLMVLDLPLSAAFDTLALPYTAVRQSKCGDIYNPTHDR